MIVTLIRWAGGKGKRSGYLTSLMPSEYGRYIEPFVGGGGRFLNAPVQGHRPFIGDRNPLLRTMWKTLRDDTEGLVEELGKPEYACNDKEAFRKMRAKDRDPEGYARRSDIAKSARRIRISKNGFNGLWRVNSKGQVNVPFGCSKSDGYDFQCLRSIGMYMRNAETETFCGDFGSLRRKAGKGDFVFLDPPYDGTFKGYTSEVFGDGDRRRMVELIAQLTKIGAYVRVTDADTEYTERLYGKCLKMRIIKTNEPRTISCKGNGRRPVPCIVAVNYTDDNNRRIVTEDA